MKASELIKRLQELSLNEDFDVYFNDYINERTEIHQVKYETMSNGKSHILLDNENLHHCTLTL